ncbi:pentapeptide repeat-containing protein [Nocardia sp. NPDC051832]|uniref:pentapeptide repeat-containing protein n=1 Tax=Nocardia sp. NPDC051832 TaxID=3155673 RepID=UPI00341C722B
MLCLLTDKLHRLLLGHARPGPLSLSNATTSWPGCGPSFLPAGFGLGSYLLSICCTQSFALALGAGRTRFLARGAGFDGTNFSGDIEFHRAAFADAVSFAGADFGAGQVDFAGPLQWGPPPPRFDWSDDGTGKPVNVEPQDWPPTVIST